MRTQVTTILGVLVAIFGALSTPDLLALLPPKFGAIITGVGILLAALGRSLLAPTNAPRP